MIIGFTGTRSGMSDNQKKEVVDYLYDKDVKHVVHGGCIGADEDFHKICLEMDIDIHVRPGHSSKDGNSDFHFDFSDAALVHESETYFKRNRAIVEECDVLIGTPYNNNQQGGTWYTLCHGKKVGKKVIIFKGNEDEGVKAFSCDESYPK